MNNKKIIEKDTVMEIDTRFNPSPQTNSEKIVYGITDKGNRLSNEDNILIKKIDDIHLLIVADGVGGHNAGDFASNMAINILQDLMSKEYNRNLPIKDLENLLKKYHAMAHMELLKNAIDDKKGMGTTLTTSIIKEDKCIIANTGDSRAYLIRDNYILSKTADHSLVQELIDGGHISEEKAMIHPLKNIITSALGLTNFKVDVYEWNLIDGDVILISSDGLHDYVSKKDILNIVKNNNNSKDIVNKLFKLALKKTKDNVSIICYKKFKKCRL